MWFKDMCSDAQLTSDETSMVSFMSQFGLRDARITGNALYLAVSMKAFLEAISI